MRVCMCVRVLLEKRPPEGAEAVRSNGVHSVVWLLLDRKSTHTRIRTHAQTLCVHGHIRNLALLEEGRLCAFRLFVDLLLSMAHLDGSFEYYEWVINFGPGVVQPIFKMSDFVKPREPIPKFPPQVHAGGEDEFAELLRAYGAKCLMESDGSK